jgi:hypothetical protein
MKVLMLIMQNKLLQSASGSRRTLELTNLPEGARPISCK